MDPLSRPVWSALTTRQAAIAVGDELAVRMAEDYGPFGAAADGSPESLAALAALIPADSELWLVETDPLHLPPNTTILHDALCVQMVAAAMTPSPARFQIIPLTNAGAILLYETLGFRRHRTLTATAITRT